MIARKNTPKIVAAITALAVLLCLCAAAFSDSIAAAADTGVSMEYEQKLFDTGSILTVNIVMDEASWNDMLENATAEEYFACDVEINGTTFYRVGIRPKGNTSLVANHDRSRCVFTLRACLRGGRRCLLLVPRSLLCAAACRE